MLKRLNYVGAPTRDQDRALTFWTEAMGCIIATDRLIGSKRWIELTIPGAQTGLLLLTPEGQEDRVGTFFNGSFGCDDVQYTYEKLLKRGVKFLAPPEMKPFPPCLLQGPRRQHVLPVEPLARAVVLRQQQTSAHLPKDDLQSGARTTRRKDALWLASDDHPAQFSPKSWFGCR